MTDERAAVDDLLRRYFDALYFSDADAIGRIFHPRAIYATADEDPPLYLSMREYVAVVARRPSPASRGEARHDVVESVEFAGENTALARVRCSIGDRRFLDFLSLVRDHGEWRIIAKLFQIVPGRV